MKVIKTTKGIVEEALKKSKKLRESYLKSKWKEIIGENLEKRVALEKVEEKTLYIIGDSAVVANLLRIESENIKEKINTLLKENYIDEVRIKIGKVK